MMFFDGELPVMPPPAPLPMPRILRTRRWLRMVREKIRRWFHFSLGPLC
jgi:hypothetical protein